MNWEDAHLFLAVARSGQILNAANQLGISQAKLSRRVIALEESLGLKLLIRRSQGCDLTEDGEALFQSLERVEAEFIQTESLLSSQGTKLSGTVRIGAPDGFGAAFLAPRLGRFAGLYPELKLQLAPVPRSFSLAKREADIAIMIGRPEKTGLMARKLADYSLGLYAAPSYLAMNPAPLTTSDLKQHQLIDYVEDLIYSPLLDYSREIWRGWQANIEITSALAQAEAVRGGAGIGILHDYIAAKDSGLVRVLPDESVIRTYWLVYHESLRDIPRVRAALDFLIDIVKENDEGFVLSSRES
ncbi:MAG: LysR family transcriptional regulator [Arenicella sp.]